MSDSGGPHATGDRFYGDLAPWWPLVSPVDDYAEEVDWLAGLLLERAPGRELLELGSGGGHVAWHVRRHGFLPVLVDRAPGMLAVSEALNPGCEHLVGDMRTVRLDRRFDVVVVHDAVSYLVDPGELAQLAATARAHLRPGGIVVLLPDEVRETFEPGTDHGGVDGDDGRAVRFLEWTYDPDPTDTVVTTEYAFLLRHADGRVEAVHETHHHGLFDRATWLAVLADAGFVAEAVPEVTTEDRHPRDVFVGTLPRDT